MRLIVHPRHMPFLSCLSSRTRVEIVGLLGTGYMNIRELAAALHISSAIVTRHIRMLEKAEIVCTENMPGKRGTQKRCTLKAGEVTLVFEKEASPENYQVVSLPVGQYVDCRVKAPCGLAAEDNYVGLCEDARYFSAPEYIQAALL